MSNEKYYYVYIMSNWSNLVLYVGMTNNLHRRVYEHKNKQNNGFTKKYNINKLLYYEVFQDILLAIEREKQIKKWSRKKKYNLMDNVNSELRDLSDDFK